MKLAWATWAINGKGMAGIEEHKSTQNPFVAIWFRLFHEIHQHHVRFGRGFLTSEFRNWTHNQYNQHSQWPNECSLLLKAKTLPNGMSCQASKAKSVRLEVTKCVRFQQDCLTDFRSNKRQLQSVAENICGKPHVTQCDPPGAAAPSVLGESLRWSKLRLNTELKPSGIQKFTPKKPSELDRYKIIQNTNLQTIGIIISIMSICPCSLKIQYKAAFTWPSVSHLSQDALQLMTSSQRHYSVGTELLLRWQL